MDEVSRERGPIVKFAIDVILAWQPPTITIKCRLRPSGLLHLQEPKLRAAEL